MRERMLDFIVCPTCKVDLELEASSRSEDGAIREGSLTCKKCRAVYQIRNFIPRFVIEQPQASDRAKTRKSFGYQWTRKMFSSMIPRFKEDFLNYIYPVKSDFFPGKIGVDIGCGFGRHIYYAAKFGAEMVGVDFSAAIESAYNNTRDLANVHLVQADIYNLPLRDNYFDFAYSIGVLHHLPEPEKGFRGILPLLKRNGHIAIWVYSKSRLIVNFIIETIRLFAKRIPHRLLYFICIILSVLEWLFLILPYQIFSRVPLLNRFVDKITFRRIKIYSDYPFRVLCADWFDRLSAPIRYYYNGQDLIGWFKRANLKIIKITPTAGYGWRALGEYDNRET